MYYLFKSRIYKNIAIYFLSGVTYGNIELIEVSSAPISGAGEVNPVIEKKIAEKVNQSILSPSIVENYPTVKIFVKDPLFYEKWILEGEAGIGMAYANDYFYTNDLDKLLQIIYENHNFYLTQTKSAFPSLDEMSPFLFPRGMIPVATKDEKEINTLLFNGKNQMSFLSNLTQHILPKHDEIISKRFTKNTIEYLKVEMENDEYIQYLEESILFFESNEKHIVEKYDISTFRAYKYAFASLKYLMNKNIITHAKYIFY